MVRRDDISPNTLLLATASVQELGWCTRHRENSSPRNSDSALQRRSSADFDTLFRKARFNRIPRTTNLTLKIS